MLSRSMRLTCLSIATFSPSASGVEAVKDPGNLAAQPVDDQTTMSVRPLMRARRPWKTSGKRVLLLDLEQRVTDP